MSQAWGKLSQPWGKLSHPWGKFPRVGAKMIGAKDAKHSGLINEYCEPEELLSTCENIARKIIKNSPRAISKAIKCINASLKNENGFDTEIEEFGKCFQTDDFIEGTTAFLEKRKPKYN